MSGDGQNDSAVTESAPATEQDTSTDQAPVDTESQPEAAPQSAADRMKAKLRAVLAAQPHRGVAVHKDDLLACLDALIDGPDSD